MTVHQLHLSGAKVCSTLSTSMVETQLVSNLLPRRYSIAKVLLFGDAICHLSIICHNSFALYTADTVYCLVHTRRLTVAGR